MLTCKFVAVGSYCLRTPWDQKCLCSYIMNASKRMLTEQNRPGLYVTHKTQQMVCLCKQVTLRKRHERGWVSHIKQWFQKETHIYNKDLFKLFLQGLNKKCRKSQCFWKSTLLKIFLQTLVHTKLISCFRCVSLHLHELDRKTIQAKWPC